ncbi:hypothetical protein [Streptomyces eurythermus]
MTLTLAGCAYPTVDLGDLDTIQTPSAEQELLGRSLQLYKDAPSVTVTARAAVAMGSPVAISTDRRHNCRLHAQNGAFEVMVERGERTWMSWGADFLSLRGTDDPLYQALNGKWLALSTDGRIRVAEPGRRALSRAPRSAPVRPPPRRPGSVVVPHDPNPDHPAVASPCHLARLGRRRAQLGYSDPVPARATVTPAPARHRPSGARFTPSPFYAASTPT